MILTSRQITNLGGSLMNTRSILKVNMRGLATALSVVTIASFLIQPVSASTSNELRESLGMSPNNYGQTINYNNSSGLVDSDSKNESGTAINEEDRENESLIEYIDNNKDISVFQESIKQLENRLKSRLENGSSAYIVTITVDDIIKNKNELNKIISAGSSIKPNKGSINSQKSDKTDKTSEDQIELDSLTTSSIDTEELAKINSLGYDIGGIGDHACSVVENYLILETPWGFNKKASETVFTQSKLLGIDLYAQPDDDIVAQWNGVVVNIFNDSTNNLQCIKVYHGNSTYTLYSHVYPLSDIYVGTTVRQGQTIAKAADTSKFEPDKANHIFYQVKLNGDFVNPLLIYGNRGKAIYEKWLTSHAVDNVVESGENYYNNVEYTDKKEYDVPEVVFPDFNT